MFPPFSQSVRCGQSSTLHCANVCGNTLNCGEHNCNQVCHAGKCQPCQQVIHQGKNLSLLFWNPLYYIFSLNKEKKIKRIPSDLILLLSCNWLKSYTTTCSFEYHQIKVNCFNFFLHNVTISYISNTDVSMAAEHLKACNSFISHYCVNFFFIKGKNLLHTISFFYPYGIYMLICIFLSFGHVHSHY